MIRNTISCDHCDTVISESAPIRRPLEYANVKLRLYSYGDKSENDQHTKGEYHLCKACIHKLKDLLGVA